MKHSFLLVLMDMLLVQLCFATTRRVGFLASTQPVANLDYVNFQALHHASTHFK